MIEKTKKMKNYTLKKIVIKTTKSIQEYEVLAVNSNEAMELFKDGKAYNCTDDNYCNTPREKIVSIDETLVVEEVKLEGKSTK